jgi:hypothetical protein
MFFLFPPPHFFLYAEVDGFFLSDWMLGLDAASTAKTQRAQWAEHGIAQAWLRLLYSVLDIVV